MNLINIFMVVHAFLAVITIPPYIILIKDYILERKDIKQKQKTLYFILNILAIGGLMVALLNVFIAFSFLLNVDFIKYKNGFIIALATRAILIDIALLASSWGFTFVASKR